MCLRGPSSEFINNSDWASLPDNLLSGWFKPVYWIKIVLKILPFISTNALYTCKIESNGTGEDRMDTSYYDDIT